MILRRILFVLFFLFIIISCVTKPVSKVEKPSWLTSLSGYNNVGLVATGCAKMHIKNFSAQKNLAVQRAISSLSMQKQTKVTTISNSGEKRKQGVLISSSYNRDSNYQTNTNISYKIKEEYFDKLNKEYCVLIQE